MPLPGADATRPSANTLALNLIDLKNRSTRAGVRKSRRKPEGSDADPRTVAPCESC